MRSPAHAPFFALAPALVLGAGAGACFDEPDYEGRACFINEPCPAGWTCGADAKCHRSTADAGGVEDDAGAAGDAGAIDPARCTDPLAYPSDAWEARYYYLPTDPAIDPASCFGVEDVATEFLQRDFMLDGPTPEILTFASTYTGTRMFEGALAFRIFHDDGIRIYLDDTIFYDHWRGPISLPVRRDTRYLAPQMYAVRVEHWDSQGLANVQITWDSACAEERAPDSGWSLHYHRLDSADRIDLDDCFGAGTVATSSIALDYGSSAPRPVREAGVTDRFAIAGSARRIFSGSVTFQIAHDDGLRVLDGTSVLYEDLTPGPRRAVSIARPLDGAHQLSFEYFDYAGGAAVSISF